jgi:circadian clock protein KaiC
MKRSVRLITSGIQLVDSTWGGFYKGGTYLLVGERKTGKTLISIQYAVEAAKQKGTCLFFTNARPKDIIIQAASIDVDLEDYINQNKIIIVRVAPPNDFYGFSDRDNLLSEYLSDIENLVAQYNPSRLVFDEITPYVDYDDTNKLKSVFTKTFESIEDRGITSLLVLREPASIEAQLIFNVLGSFATGVIQLYKSTDESGIVRGGVMDIQPNVGHSEGRFKANYSIEPYKGVVTHFKLPKSKEAESNKLSDLKKNNGFATLFDVDNKNVAEELTNVYSLDEFKLMVNNHIAMNKTTGQTFSIISFRLVNPELKQSALTLNQLKNVIKISIDKKDKLCHLSDVILVLFLKEDVKLLNNLLAKIKSNLPSDNPDERAIMAKDVIFRIITVNDSYKDADDMIADVTSSEEVFKSLITKN